MAKTAVLLSVLILSGCVTSENNIYGGLAGQNVVGNEVYVTVSNVWNEMDALPLADKHCQKCPIPAVRTAMTQANPTKADRFRGV